MFREGLLAVVSGPSGSGKGTLLKLICNGKLNVGLSISATTRKPREGEIDGQHYFFKTVEDFKEMVNQEQLIEWVEYCNNFYGTPKKYIEDSIKKGKDMILEIDVEGALKIKEKYPQCILIFILPPSFEELRKRIIGRGTEIAEVIEKRLEKAKKEIAFISNYDYIIINDEVNRAVDELDSILKAEKVRFARNTDILSKLGMV
ncbi:MAG: guanylate kinase [Clostridia bacterium]|nr:guanylate kinase [Clostridia bacterium]